MSSSWSDFAAYAFVYAPGLACVVLCLVKVAGRVMRQKQRATVEEPDPQLDYFLCEAERLMADRRRVQRQRDAMLLRNAPNWPPPGQAPPKFPLVGS